MSAARVILRIDLRSYWHAGGGRDGGAVHDAVVHRDPDGLPVLPGRHIKGLLRDAVTRAGHWGWPGFEALAERLFGHAGTAGEATSPGCLRVSDGCLPRAVSAYLTASEEGRSMQAEMFRSLYATAVTASGVARDHSLRGIEVAVPMTLWATVETLPGYEAPEGWQQRLEQVLPLIDSVGAYRSRGLGRVALRLEKEEI